MTEGERNKPDPGGGVPAFVKWGLFYPAIVGIVVTLIASAVEILSGIFGWR